MQPASAEALLSGIRQRKKRQESALLAARKAKTAKALAQRDSTGPCTSMDALLYRCRQSISSSWQLPTFQKMSHFNRFPSLLRIVCRMNCLSGDSFSIFQI
jgi:hypothetical protein